MDWAVNGSGMWLNLGDKIVRQAQPKRHLSRASSFFCRHQTHVLTPTRHTPNNFLDFLQHSLDHDGMYSSSFCEANTDKCSRDTAAIIKTRIRWRCTT
jgi:hypothetical protein